MLSSFSKEDVVARKRLAELLVGEHDVRLAIAVWERGSSDLKSVFQGLRRECEERMSGLGKRFDMMYKSMLVFNTPTLVAVIGIPLKMVLAP